MFLTSILTLQILNLGKVLVNLNLLKWHLGRYFIRLFRKIIVKMKLLQAYFVMDSCIYLKNIFVKSTLLLVILLCKKLQSLL
jgi:hypothetical protein